MQDHFSTLIGQSKIKKKFNFYLQGYHQTKYFPPILSLGTAGVGKTVFNRTLGKSLRGSDGKPKKFIEVSGKSVRDLGSFVTDIVEQFVAPQEEITLFLDEVGNMAKETMEWMLFALQPNLEKQSIASYGGQDYIFNLKKLTILAATTNAEKLPLPFLSRFKKFEFEPYQENELIKILEKNCGEIKFLDDAEIDIVSVARESPREIVFLSEDIKQYCETYKIKKFGKSDWRSLSNQLSISPFGLSAAEIGVLKLLDSRGPLTLTNISACLGRDTNTVRKNIELFLLKKGLMKIDQKRIITGLGRQVVNKCF